MSRDPGLQPERTRLAWRRTVLSLTVVALLAGRLALGGGSAAVGAAATAAVVAAWLALLLLSYRRISRLAAARPAPVGRVLPLAALAVLGYAALGIALVTVGSA